MKTLLKALTALAAFAGALYVIATYGDKIVAWAKKVVINCPCSNECKCAEEAPAEEAAVEEAAVEEAPAEEVPVEEIVIEENEPVAAEEDFAE